MGGGAGRDGCTAARLQGLTETAALAMELAEMVAWLLEMAQAMEPVELIARAEIGVLWALTTFVTV